jgi:hypothetical protein
LNLTVICPTEVVLVEPVQIQSLFDSSDSTYKAYSYVGADAVDSGADATLNFG